MSPRAIGDPRVLEEGAIKFSCLKPAHTKGRRRLDISRTMLLLPTVILWVVCELCLQWTRWVVCFDCCADFYEDPCELAEAETRNVC